VLDSVEPRDRALMRRISWQLKRINLGSTMRWRVLRAAQTSARGAHVLTDSPHFADFALSAYTLPLRHAALATPAELYIAHYPAALPAAAAAARKHGARFAYDAEDFHLGDLPEDPIYDDERQLVRNIEARYLPRSAYVTAASPGIAQAYVEAYGIQRPRVVLNAFPLRHAAPGPTPRGLAQPGPSLYWFSQTIGPNRGLECAIRAVGLARLRPHLYLRGTWATTYGAQLLDLSMSAGAADRVHLLHPDEPDKMEKLAMAYDTGLCGEPAGTRNNAIALSNKLFAYLLAGVSPLMSDTPAHCAFAAEAGLTDFIYPREDPAALAALLDSLLSDVSRLAASRALAWRLGQERYNWETERGQLIEAVERATKRSGSRTS
jgi:glycosyltransferase involved in cell wall biosynthesis